VDLAPTDKLLHVSEVHGLHGTLDYHLTTNLLTKIHRLVNQPLILKPRLDWSLLKPYSLMILLRHLWKEKLPNPSTISIHRHRPCR